MFKFVAILSFIVVAHAARLTRDVKEEPHVIEILKSESETSEDGSYSFLFEGADGSFRQEKAVAVNPGTEDAYLSITGTYKYIDGDGQVVEVNYSADQKGFVPVGSNIDAKISEAARLAHDEAEPEEKFTKSGKRL